MDHPSRYSRKPLLGCLLIAGLLVVCFAVTTVGLDAACYATLSRRMPVYPNAEVRVERHNLFRSLGMGETYVEMYSTDSVEQIRTWYNEATIPYMRQATRDHDPLYPLARSQFDVTRSEDRTGSAIRLYGRCVQ